MVPLDPVPQTIDRVFQGPADAPALLLPDRTMTFGEADAAVDAMAAWLTARGLDRGDRVATWLPKTATACLMPLATARAGLVHVPVNPALRRAQVAHILADSGARALVTQAARAATFEAGDVPGGCAMVEEGEVESAAALQVTSAPRRGPGSGRVSGNGERKTNPDDLAAILYTSGSTGRPKGVMLSHANLWLGAVSVAHYLKLTGDDVVLAVLPLSFDYGQNQLFSTWYAGGAVAPLDYLTPRDVVGAVERTGATTLAGVPPLWVQLIEAEWPAATAARLKRLTNSGGALTPRLVRALRERFPAADLYAMYGLTEAFRATFLDPALIDAQPDAIGRAVPFAEVLVARADGTAAAPGEPGELVQAGPLVAQGYWRQEAATAARFHPAPDWSASGGTAVWSGDTVVAGADGLLRFVGRDDETIKTAGNRVSPTEIEEAVTAGDETAEAIALGLPDERLGQAIVVVAAGDGAAEAALRARLRRDLPSFQQPVRYVWLAGLPRNANGKLDRVAVRGLASGVAETVGGMSSSEGRAGLRQAQPERGLGEGAVSGAGMVRTEAGKESANSTSVRPEPVEGLSLPRREGRASTSSARTDVEDPDQ